MPGPLVDFVRVNNTRYSWTSCIHRVDSQRTKGIVAVDFEQKRERKIVYAAQQNGVPLGWTAGKYSVPSFTMRFLREWANSFTDYLTTGGLINPGNGSFGDAEWSYTLQVVEPVVGAVPITTVCTPCAVIGVKEAQEEGVDELVTEFEIACLTITENGKRLYSAVRELAG